DQVQMFPRRERPMELAVAKMMSILIVEMFYDPAAAKRTDTHTEDGGSAVLDAARPLQHFEWAPRWVVTLEGARLRMPTKHHVGRSFQTRTADENVLFHAGTPRLGQDRRRHHSSEAVHPRVKVEATRRLGEQSTCTATQ